MRILGNVNVFTCTSHATQAMWPFILPETLRNVPGNFDDGLTARRWKPHTDSGAKDPVF
jgi:hypothetical protein